MPNAAVVVLVDCEQSVFSPQIFGVSGNVIKLKNSIPKGQQSLFDTCIFQAKTSENEKDGGGSKEVAVVQDSREESDEDDSSGSDTESSESNCED